MLQQRGREFELAEGRLAERAVSGIGWSTSVQLLRQSLQFVILTALARLLVPHDFGLVAMLYVFMGFASVIGEAGFEAALVQRRRVGDVELSTIFFANTLLSVFVMAIAMVCARTIAGLYHEPRLAALVVIASAVFPINALGAVPRAVMTRSLLFRKLVLCELVGVIVGGVTAIVLATHRAGPLALIAQAVTASTVTTTLLGLCARWRPRLQFDVPALRGILRYSLNLTAFNTVNYWARNGDNLLVGRYLGSALLGFYERAYLTVLFPVTNIAGAIGRVMFPSMARIQEDHARVRSAYLRATALIALVTFPIMVGLAVVAREFVIVFFGHRWLPMVPLLRIFAVVGAVQSVGTSVGWIYQSQGRTDLHFRWGAIASAFILAAIGLGVWTGSLIALAAIYGTMAAGLLLYPTIAIPLRLIGGTFGSFARNLGGVALATSLMAGGVGLLQRVSADHWNAGPALVAEATLGAALYVAALTVFRVAAFADLRAILRRHFVTQLRLPAPWRARAVAAWED